MHKRMSRDFGIRTSSMLDWNVFRVSSMSVFRKLSYYSLFDSKEKLARCDALYVNMDDK
jgi:hypothetical protein